MLTIALLHPELLGTYGDGGNALVLATRAQRRGFTVDVIEVGINDEVPAASLYLLGGGEDGPQRQSTDVLRATSFASRLNDGAYAVAVCAGLQILGTSFAVEGDDEFAGLGVVEAITKRGPSRSVGEMMVRVGDHDLVGFENHGGRTTLGENLQPFGRVIRGRGNGNGVDGYRTDRIWATYAHGPVMAMNPWFADEVLSAVLSTQLPPLSSVADRLYEERLRTLSR